MARLKPFLTLALLVSLATACQASPALDANESSAAVSAEAATGAAVASLEQLRIPPWMTDEYSQRQVELSGIYQRAFAQCVADLGVTAPEFAQDQIPLHYRAGLMTPERAELFGYGATFQIASSFESYPPKHDSDIAARIYQRADTQPCYAPADAARAAAAGDLEDRSNGEVIEALGALSERATSTVEYEAWSQSWHACMLRGDVAPRSTDPLSHGASIMATFAGRLASEGIITETELDNGAFTVDWFQAAVAETPALRTAFDEERELARADADCVADTATELRAAVDAAS